MLFIFWLLLKNNWNWIVILSCAQLSKRAITFKTFFKFWSFLSYWKTAGDISSILSIQYLWTNPFDLLQTFTFSRFLLHQLNLRNTLFIQTEFNLLIIVLKIISHYSERCSYLVNFIKLKKNGNSEEPLILREHALISVLIKLIEPYNPSTVNNIRVNQLLVCLFFYVHLREYVIKKIARGSVTSSETNPWNSKRPRRVCRRGKGPNRP